MKNSLLIGAMFIFNSLSSASTYQPLTSTIVRNGGDPVLTHLRSLSEALSQTTRDLNGFIEDKALCRGLSNFHKEQKCRALLLEAGPQIAHLISSRKVDFVLSEKPLKVPSPHGPESVSARTALGPSGPIEVHRSIVWTASSRTLMTLIAHEYLHKVLLDGQYVTDDEKRPPFSNGRELIDTLAAALTELAAKRGHWALENGIRDIFSCTVSVDGMQITSKFSTPRRQLEGYRVITETSMGFYPTDAALSFSSGPDITWRFRFSISDNYFCRKSSRGIPATTLVQIVREQHINGKKSEAVVARQSMDRNPLCDKKEFELRHENVHLRCQYLGSENGVLQR